MQNHLASVTSLVYLPFRQLKNSKKKERKLKKRKKLGEINKIKAENILLCKIVSEGEVKIRNLKINQKKVFKTC